MLTQSCTKMSAALCMIVMTMMGILMFLFAPQLLSLMTPVDAMIAIGAKCLRIEAFAEPMVAAAIVCSGIFFRAGAALRHAPMILV